MASGRNRMRKALMNKMVLATLSYGGALMMTSTAALAAEASRAPAGTLADGTAIEAITLKNAQGVSATILTYGAQLQNLAGQDRNGKLGRASSGERVCQYV